MATFKQCVGSVVSLATDIVLSAQPLGAAAKYASAATAEATLQLLVAVAASNEERKAAQDILAQYFPEKPKK